MNAKNKIIVFLIILFLGGLVFYLVDFVYFKNKPLKILPDKKIQKIIMLTGNLAEVKKNSLILKSQKGAIYSLDEKEKYNLEEVKINSKTRIVRRTDATKSKDQFKQEQEEFKSIISNFKKDNKSTIGIEAPSWYIFEEIKIKDLKIGDNLKIFAYEYKGSLVAQKIFVELKTNSQAGAKQPDKSNIKLQLSGVIKEINGDKIKMLKDSPGIAVPQQVEEIYINTQTSIVLKVKKSDEQFKKEQLIFNSAVKKLKENNGEASDIKAPDWYVVKDVKISDLENGQKVVVYAFKNSGDSRVTASKIEIIKE